jgi:hypothetical protein
VLLLRHDNSERILLALDSHMDHERRLVIFGRAAIALGFADAPVEASRSHDVDVIIPVSETEKLRADISFWEAQQSVNRELQSGARPPAILVLAHPGRAASAP